jgi:hypothetical protein
MENQTLTPQDTPQGSGMVKLLSAQVLDPTLGISTNLENAIFALPNNADLGSGTIVAGQSITISFQYVRFVNGAAVSDRVNASLRGLPRNSAGIFNPAADIPTFQRVTLTVTTFTLTPAGSSVLEIGGSSAIDGTPYEPGIFRLTVQAPKGKETKETKETKDKDRDKTKERFDTLAKPKDTREKDINKDNKDLKQEGKELKDLKPEGKEAKDFKDDKEKEIGNKDLIKDKDFIKDLDGGGGKGKEFSDGGPRDLPLPLEPIAFGTMEERLLRLESAMAQLRHFISPELRPDLTRGALRAEADYQPVDPSTLSQQLQQQATDAKQAKDNKDVEKLNEQ